MCGRFAAGDMTQAQMLAIMQRFLYGVEVGSDENATTGYNIKPTNPVFAICNENGSNKLVSARWWFVPNWHKGDVKEWKQTTFNALIETAFKEPTFRKAWNSHRCVIPAVGYYEWTGSMENKLPNYVTLDRNEPFIYFAGLHSTLSDGTKTCAILTREAEPEISDIHHRMPVILNKEQIKGWMTHATNDEHVIANYGCEWTNRFLAHRVAKFGIKDDGPELIEPDGLAF
ncbi:SOS response-associated peptidase [Litoreibacter sp.]|nr:SOS response-associated peptidase [Litoreibacter sp.]